jgi:hypothetical protein
VRQVSRLAMRPGVRYSPGEAARRRKSCSATIQLPRKKLAAAQSVSKLKVLVKGRILLLMSKIHRSPMMLEVTEMRH